jgi:hypothetical protein
MAMLVFAIYLTPIAPAGAGAGPDVPTFKPVPAAPLRNG